MPLIDITKPEVTKFLVESYEKTAKLRMRWNNLYREEVLSAARFHKEPKGQCDTDVMMEAMAAGMPAISRDHKSSKRNRRKKPETDNDLVLGISEMKRGHTIPVVGLGHPSDDPRLGRPDDDFTEDPIMRPVDTEQREIIYKGLPNFGREYYLKVRNKMDPEQKYYFDECSSWEYGWRLNDSYFAHHAPSCGRVQLLTREGMSRSGPQPDPPHYSSPDQPTKCS